MKRTALPSFLFAILLLGLPLSQASAQDVCPSSCSYSSIQAAVDAASVNDIIDVQSGTYAEDVTVDKDLTLNGPNAGTSGNGSRNAEATINGNVTLSVSGITFDGFEVSPPNPSDQTKGEAILVNKGSDNVTVRNNVVRDFESDNLVGDDIEGIAVFGGDGSDALTGATITQNRVTNITRGGSEFGGAVGITVQGNVDNSTVSDNEITLIGNGTGDYSLAVAVRSTDNHNQDPQGVVVTNNTITDIHPDPSSPYDGVGFEFEPEHSANPVTVQNNSFSNTTLQFEDKTASLDTEAFINNNTLDRAVVVRTAPGSGVKNEGGVKRVYSSIQPAVDAADTGEIVDVYGGTYAEQVEVATDDLTITGEGDGTAPSSNTILDGNGASGNNGIRVNADGVTVEGLRASGYVYGVHIIEQAIADLSLNGVTLTDNQDGMRISGRGVDGLSVTDSHFDDNAEIGLYIAANQNGEEVKSVDVTNTTFSGNPKKGIYAERLDDATLDDIFVNESGTSGSYAAGIDINLKYQDYNSISLNNVTVKNSGTGDPINGVGLTVKARNDAPSYSGSPASLESVSITNSIIKSNQSGIGLGNNIQSASITGSLIANNTNTGIFYGVDSGSSVNLDANQNCIIQNGVGVKEVNDEEVDATNNWWGSANGPSASDVVGANVDTDPFATQPVSGIDGCSGSGGGCVASGKPFWDGNFQTNQSTHKGSFTLDTDNGFSSIQVKTSDSDNIALTEIRDESDNVIGDTTRSGKLSGPFNSGWKTINYTGSMPLTSVKVVVTPLEENSSQFMFNLLDESGCNLQVDPQLKLATPSDYTLDGNYPNPFSDNTTIRFKMPEASDVHLVIYNTLGRKVRTLVDRQMEVGTHEAAWNGLSESGTRLASGVYFYRLEAGSFTKTQRLVLVQ